MIERYQELISQGYRIPGHLKHYFAPAEICLYEWHVYYFEIPGADRLRVGNRWIDAIRGSLFLLRFENQLGLVSVQAYYGKQPLAEPLTIEVISRKFPDVARHHSFFQSLLTDLFTRASRLPFTISAPTTRGVGEAWVSPTPLFVLHFICQYFQAFRDAVQLIQTRPHRQLMDHIEKVPLARAKQAEPDVLIDILHHPSEWVPASGFPLADKLHGYAPLRVRQQAPYETFDTPENRFVLHFLQRIIVAAQSLPSQRWWHLVPEERQLLVRSILNLARQSLHHPVFSETGQMRRLPFESRVLMRRDGYREMLAMWQIFNHARKPLFAPLQQAIDLHDIATLYEMWVFFALIEEVAVLFNASPIIDLKFSQQGSLGWNAQAHFGPLGTLGYNQSAPSYSVPFRPDFAWYRDDRLELVFDSKFRMERHSMEGSAGDVEPESVSKRDDLYKMHTYRDALDIMAAIVIYPGQVPVFYDKRIKKKTTSSLREILMGNFSGIGAIPMKPDSLDLEREI